MECSKPDMVRVHFAARTLAYAANTGRKSEWLLPLSSEHGLRGGAFPVDVTMMLQERWLVRALLTKWPLNKMGDFSVCSLINLLRRHTLHEQCLICEILEKQYGFY